LVFASHEIQTLDVASCAESPAATAASLVFDWADNPLLHPVPYIRGCGLRFIFRVICEILNVIELRKSRNDETHQCPSLANSKISKLGLAVESMVIGICIHALDFKHVFEVDGEAIILDDFGFIALAVLVGIGFELVIL